MTAPLQSSHLFAQHMRITTIPAIGDEEHDRRLMQHAPRPSLMELPQCRTDARATGPVGHHVGYGIDCFLKPPQPDLPCHTREPGGEEKHLEAPATMCEAMREVQQHARVALHRAADIAQEHERPRSRCGGAVSASVITSPPVRRLRIKRTTQIDAGAAATNPPASPPFARNPVQLLERDPRARHLVGRELGEVLVRQAADLAPRLKDALNGLRRHRPLSDPSSGGNTPAVAETRAAVVRASLTVAPCIANGLAWSRQNASKTSSNRRQLLVTLDEQRTTRVKDFVTRVEFDVRERFGQVEDATDGNIEADPSQQPAEDDRFSTKCPATQLPSYPDAAT